MGNRVVISVEKLGKSYRIHHEAERQSYVTIRDMLADNLRGLFHRSAAPIADSPSTENFWALEDVSFEVKEGEVIGIIGRNGAGKSTLLKILSRITEPTKGRVRIKGRVASLLEVGTGFHPELTGRENVFLNGAILGMSRAEIRKKFDEIVAFAEVEKFLDTPVKRYSSGMHVRLAFAVAAHLEPEILIVDEVLAVGDAQFQQRCLGKMQDVASKDRRTVLFVSHNLPAVQQLCGRSVLLVSGKLAYDGNTSDVIQRYLSDARTGTRVDLTDWRDRQGSGEGRITEMELYSANSGEPIAVGGRMVVRLHAVFTTPMTNPCFGVIVHDSLGTPLLDLRSIHDHLQTGRVEGHVTVEMTLPDVGLYPARYLLSPWITDAACSRDIDFAQKCHVFEVHSASGQRGDMKLNPVWGKYFVPSKWSVKD